MKYIWYSPKNVLTLMVATATLSVNMLTLTDATATLSVIVLTLTIINATLSVNVLTLTVVQLQRFFYTHVCKRVLTC